MTDRSVHLVVPDGWSDPGRPSGGNHYDQRLARGLRDLGWQVVVHEVPGPWPRPAVADLAALAGVLADLPAHTKVLVDGLVGSPSSAVLLPQADRLRLLPLVHLPLGDATADRVGDGVDVSEHEVLESAAAVLTTSRWTRRRLLDRYGLWPGRVHVAEPGVDAAEPRSAGDDGARLACVAALVAHKGHETLLEAAGGLLDLDWHLALVGPLDREPETAQRVRVALARLRIEERVSLLGAMTGPELGGIYAQTDLLVLPSRAESYGMVATEALARGIPVLASDVGGVSEALGRSADGERPGALVAVDDVGAWTAALRRWLTEPGWRQELGARALGRRDSLRDWTWTAGRVGTVLEGVG